MDTFRESKTNLADNTPLHKTQYLTAFCAALGSFAMGTILGYSSTSSLQLKEPDNSSYINITEDCGGELSLTLTGGQISWFGSIVNIGALVGAPCAGFLMKTQGRRFTMVGSVAAFLLGWLLLGKFILVFHIDIS